MLSRTVTNHLDRTRLPNLLKCKAKAISLNSSIYWSAPSTEPGRVSSFLCRICCCLLVTTMKGLRKKAPSSFGLSAACRRSAASRLSCASRFSDASWGAHMPWPGQLGSCHSTAALCVGLCRSPAGPAAPARASCCCERRKPQCNGNIRARSIAVLLPLLRLYLILLQRNGLQARGVSLLQDVYRGVGGQSRRFLARLCRLACRLPSARHYSLFLKVPFAAVGQASWEIQC